MNDRFKFCAWNIKKKSMIQDIGVLSSNAFCSFMEDPNGAGNSVNPREENYILMQCTSLKDKNGKLIYEGDIVKRKKYSEYEIEAVEWSEIGYDCCEAGSGFVFSCFSFDSEDFEIIGNIYENPELLKNLK